MIFFAMYLDRVRSSGYSEGYEYGVKVVEERTNDLIDLQAQKIRCYESQRVESSDECIAKVLRKRDKNSGSSN